MDILSNARSMRLILGIGASIVVVAIWALIVWMADAANQVAKQNSVLLVERAIESKIETLAALTYDYAYWEQAYHWIADRDDEAMFDNFGTSAADGPHFEYIFLMDSGGTPIYAYARGLEESDLSIVDTLLTSRLVDLVQSLPPEQFEVTSGIAAVHGDIALVAAARVQPQVPQLNGLTSQDLPILVAVQVLHPDSLSVMGEELLLSEVVLQMTDNVEAGNSFVTLNDVSEDVVARLEWRSPDPGALIVRANMPAFLAISILILGGGLIAGRSELLPIFRTGSGVN